MQLQTGVLRTNCVDCLDRTNVAQARMRASPRRGLRPGLRPTLCLPVVVSALC